MRSFHITNVRTDDELAVDRLVGFLAANPHGGIRVRPRTEVDRAVSSGLALRVDEGEAPKGCSLVYNYSGQGEAPVYSEIGTMRITANGFGLQYFLINIHILQIYVEEFYAPRNIFGVVEPGTASDHVLRNNAQMVPWTPPEKLRSLRAEAGVPFSEHKDILLADVPTIKLAFAKLRNWHQRENIFKAPKSDAEVILNLGWFDSKLLAIEPE
jgi:hypothetical protein